MLGHAAGMHYIHSHYTLDQTVHNLFHGQQTLLPNKTYISYTTRNLVRHVYAASNGSDQPVHPLNLTRFTAYMDWKLLHQ